MSNFVTAIDSILSNAICKREGCGHTRNEHSVNSEGFQPCTKCDCPSFQFISFSLFPDNSTLGSTTVEQSLYENTGLNQQIEQLEKELESSVKEISSLKEKVKAKTAENKELRDSMTELRIELEIANLVKKNLKNIVDKLEKEKSSN